MNTQTANTTHIIEHMVLDMTFGLENEAYAEQASLPTFLKSDLLPVVDEVFQACSDTDWVITIDRLEIDLGPIPYADYQREMVRRLRDELTALLQDHVHSRPMHTKAADDVKTQYESHRQILYHVLQYGRLPWNAPPGIEEMIERLLPEILTVHGQEMSDFVRTCPEPAIVVKRLVRQSTETSIMAFANTLNPDRYQEVLPLMKEVVQLFAVESFHQESLRVLREDLWIAIIVKLLDGRNVSWNAASVMWPILKALCLRHGFTEQAIVPWIEQRVREIENQTKKRLNISRWIPTLSSHHHPRGTDHSPSKASSARTFPDAHVQPNTDMPLPSAGEHRLNTIRESLRHGHVDTLIEAWDDLLHHHGPSLKALFKDVGRPVTIRRRLVMQFSESMLLDLVGLFAPDWSMHVATTHRVLGILWAENNRHMGSSSPIGNTLWTWTLGYLFLTPESKRDRRGHIHDLVHRLARQHPQWLANESVSINDVFRDLPAPADLRQEIHHALTVERVTVSTNMVKQAKTETRFREFLRMQDLYEFLRHSFMIPGSENPHSRQQWFEVAEQVRTQYPRQLIKLYRDLQAGELLYEHVGTPLTTEQLRWLLRSFLEIMPSTIDQTGDLSRSDLITAIQAHASRARDEKRYFEDVLRVLVSEKLIDFEEILAGLPAAIPAEAKISPSEILYKLITEFLAHSYRSPTHTSAELLEAIQTYARQACDRTAYYRLILECLMWNTAIDFQEILRTITSGSTNSELFQKRDKGHPPLFSDGTVPPPPAQDERSLPLALSDFSKGTPHPEPPYNPSAPSGEEKADNSSHGHDSISLEKQEARSTRFLKASSEVSNAQWNLVCECLVGNKDIPSHRMAALRSELNEFLTKHPTQSRDFFREALRDHATLSRVIHLLSDRLLIRVVALLFPMDYHHMLGYADHLADACLIRGMICSRAQIRQAKWESVFTLFLEEERIFNIREFIESLVERFAARLHQQDIPKFRAHLVSHLRHDRLPHAESIPSTILEILSNPQSVAPQTPSPSWDTTHLSKRTPSSDPMEAMYVTNAGLVLGAPFFPRLFSLLNLTRDSQFIDQAAAERAVHLLQWMANARTDAPEYHLILNKILCGLDIAVPLIRDIHIHGREQDAIEGLLESMIQHWARLGNTSINGFRESFLQREGKIHLRDNAWHVSVEERAFDMLLDHIPWTFATIKLPWMPRPLYVQWR